MNSPSFRRPSFGGALSSLQVPEYRMLWWAGVFSFMSVQGQFVLRGLLAWDLTEREGALGLVYLVFGLTMLFSTPFGGVSADRFAKRTVLLWSQILIFIAAVLMAVVVLTDVVEFWMLLCASVAQGLAFAFYGPARVAMAAELVGRDQLGNAITLSLLSMNATRVFAPALAGVLAGIAAVGIGGAYLLSAVMSFGSLVLIWRLPHRLASDATPRNPFTEIKAGVRYVNSDRRLRRLVVSSFFVIMFGFNYVAFLPALVEGVFDLGDTWVGLLSSAGAIGAVAVSLPLAARADGPGGRRIMVISGIGFGVGVMLLGLAPTIWLAFLVVVGIGGFTTAFQSLSNTLALTAADDKMQGRVQSLMQLSFAGFGIAAAPIGALAEVIGLRAALVIMGAVAAGATVVFHLLEGAADRRTENEAKTMMSQTPKVQVRQ
jgi:MFS family permease